LKSITSYKDNVNGVVRIEDAKGLWLLTTQRNKTKVVYQFLGNPEGSMLT